MHVLTFVPVLLAAQMEPAKAPPKPQARGVVFEDVLSSDLDDNELLSEPNTKISLTRKKT